jgi:hypothetical protein
MVHLSLLLSLQSTLPNFDGAAVAVLSALPLSSGIVRRYKEHFEEVSRQPSAPFSDKMTDFFARWSIKFSLRSCSPESLAHTAATSVPPPRRFRAC